MVETLRSGDAHAPMVATVKKMLVKIIEGKNTATDLFIKQVKLITQIIGVQNVTIWFAY